MYSLNQILKAIYATFLTNFYGLIVKRARNKTELKAGRAGYSETLLGKLNISVNVTGQENLDPDGQYLLVSNHRSVIDPLIIEMIIKDTPILGHWIAKKELYNSFFFGIFVRNAGTILLDRSSKQMGGFFNEIKRVVAEGDSIFIFPEGTRNKTDSELGVFKKGSELIARKSQLDILPIYIKTNANDVLMRSLKNSEKDLTIDVEVGEVIPYQKKMPSLEGLYKKRFGIS